MKKGIKLLFVAEILQVVAVVCGFVPVLNTVSGLCSLAGLVVFIVGLVQCKKLNEKFGKAIKFYIWAIVVAVLTFIVTFILAFALAAASDGSEAAAAAILTISTIVAAILAAISSLLELAGNVNVIKGTTDAVPETADFGKLTQKIYTIAIIVAIVAAIVGAFVPFLATIANVLEVVAYVFIVVFLGKASKHC